MNFASDNRGPAHPRIIEAISQANAGYSTPYGEDDMMIHVRDRIREIFEHPEAEVFLTATGTATNALILATLTQPWDEIYCSYTSHIRQDECNAIEFYTGGARITHVGTGDILKPEPLAEHLSRAANLDIHCAHIRKGQFLAR